MTKKTINIDVIGEGKTIKLKGRLLGLLNSKEFSKILEEGSMRTKLFGVETMGLAEMAKINNVDNLRFAVALKEKNGICITGKHMFISDPLVITNYFKEGAGEAQISSKENYYIISEEA